MLVLVLGLELELELELGLELGLGLGVRVTYRMPYQQISCIWCPDPLSSFQWPSSLIHPSFSRATCNKSGFRAKARVRATSKH